MSNYRQQSAAPVPVANDRPLIDREEMRRAEASYRSWFMSEEERLALNAADPPKMPLKSSNQSGVMRMPQRRAKA